MRSEISDLLNRPIEQRAREFKYRCAQSIVFGVPVLALQWIGPHLGGVEAPRWIALLQALLAGWVVYVGAVGMLVEGIILLHHRVSADFLIGALCVVLFGYSVVAAVPIVIKLAPSLGWPLFHWGVIVMMIWNLLRWRMLVIDSSPYEKL